MVERTKQHTETLVVDYNLFIKCVDKLAKRIVASDKHYKGIYAIPRGGLVFGVYLSHKLNIPLMPFTTSPHVLVVDDILDTGITLSKYTEYDCVVIIAKSTGLDRCPNVMYAITTADNMWAKFPWEVE